MVMMMMITMEQKVIINCINHTKHKNKGCKFNNQIQNINKNKYLNIAIIKQTNYQKNITSNNIKTNNNLSYKDKSL